LCVGIDFLADKLKHGGDAGASFFQ
jgi:hypothetical protein